jgi:two-component system, NarL family, response regulator NreC
MQVTKIRVLLADDHAVLRAGLRLLLEAQPDMHVVAEVGDATALLQQARAHEPDLILLDIGMPGPGFAETIKRVLRILPKTGIVMLTMHDDRAYLRAALVAGAAGYVVKKVADAELLSAIRAVHDGRTFIDSGRVRDERQDDAGPRGSARISRREGQVLRLLAQGHTNGEAAARLRVSVKTIETYRARLGEKLKLKTRAELYRFAVSSGLLEADADSSLDPSTT